MWEERTDDLKLLYRLSAELRVKASNVSISSKEQARLKNTAEALQKAIAALEAQVWA